MMNSFLNTTRARKARYVVLTPEASTNWLFDENVLFHLLTECIIVCMDQPDYYRYKRLAAQSDIDFLKYFLLTLLRRLKFIYLFDYKTICPPGDVVKSLDSICNSKLFQDTERHHEVIRSGYKWYLNYIAAKEKVLPLIGSNSDRSMYEREKTAAKRDLSKMDRGCFDKKDRHSYLRRLSTKLMLAQTVCNVVGGTIFDSREYQRGTTLLRTQGLLPTNARFESPLFTRPKAFDKLLSFCEKEGCFKAIPGSKMSANGILRIWLPYAILETLSKTDQGLVLRIQHELAEKSKKELGEEVEEWLQLNRKGLGCIEGYRYAKEALDAAVGLIPIIGQTLGIYKILRSFAFIHLISQARVSTAAELIGVATASEAGVTDIHLRYKLTHFWVSWFYNIFIACSSGNDKSWANSQREMGAWTDTELYVPWYEHSQEKLRELRLI